MADRDGVQRTITIPTHATFEELYGISLAEWQGMPTVSSGQFDNLKYESDTFRVWTSRMTLADYDGDAVAYAKDRLRFEKNVQGRWRLLDRYGKVEPE